jgi:hypothetical protein
MRNFKFNNLILTILCLSVLLNGCASLPKFPTGPAIEPNATKRAQNNALEGKGIQLFKSNKGNGEFQFASSNPLWKAALDTLSFVSLANSDYSGGVLITDWYSEGNPDQAIKITIRFLSNEIRPDGIVVNLYKRNCLNNVCSTKELKSDLVLEIKDKILKKAVIYKSNSDKIAKKKRPKKRYKDN